MSASSLESLAGLTTAKRAISQFMKPDSGVHAVLLYGPRGAGKTELARNLVRVWLGTEDSQAAIAFDNNRNADVLTVEPQGPSRIISVKQISANRGGGSDKFEGTPISEFLRTGPLTSAKKVVLIQDADRMNGAAANSILKSLEEPFEYAKFVLVTSSVGSLLPTILSRCVAVACELPSEQEREQLGLDTDLWRLANGAPQRAKTFQENAEIYRSILSFAKHLRSRPKRDALVASEQFRGLSDKIQKLENSNVRAANAETLELLGEAIRIYHPDWDAPLEIIEAHRRIIGNGNPGFVFDGLFARILAG